MIPPGSFCQILKTLKNLSDCWKCIFPKNLHVCVIVGWSVGLLGPSHSVGQSVCHTFLNRHKVTLQWSYRSTCYKMMTLYIENKTKDNKEDASSITIITTLNTDGFCYSV